MEVGPELCFWSDSSAELKNAPLLSLSHPVTGQLVKPYQVGGLAGVVLELESDSELEQESVKRWDEDVINLTGADLEDSETSSPVISHVSVNMELHNQRTSSAYDMASPMANCSDDMLTTQLEVDDHSRRNSTPASGMVPNNTVDSETEVSSPVAPGNKDKPRRQSSPQLSQTFPNYTSVQCSLCDRTFVNLRSRNIHMNKTHSIKTSTARTTIKQDSKRKSSIDAEKRPAGTESPKPNSPPSPQVKASTVLPTREPTNPSSPIRSDAGSIGNTPETIDNIPHSYKARPVYTVSSPTSGSSGNGGALKIRLVSVKPTKKVKRRSKAINIPPSNQSTTSSAEPAIITPERMEHNHTPAVSIAPDHVEIDPSETAFSGLDSSPELLVQSSSSLSEPPAIVSVDSEPTAHSPPPPPPPPLPPPPPTLSPPNVSHPPSPLHINSPHFPQELNTSPAKVSGGGGGGGGLHATDNPSVNQTTHSNPLLSNQSRSDVSCCKSPDNTHSAPERSPPPKNALLPTPSTTPHLFSSPALQASLSRNAPIVESPAASQSALGNSVSPVLLDTTLRTSDGCYKCRVCRRIFSNRFSLTGHYKSHYDASQKPYLCDDCGQRYTSPSNLHYHRARNCPVLKLKAAELGKPLRALIKHDRQNKQGKVIQRPMKKSCVRTTDVPSVVGSMQTSLSSGQQPTDLRIKTSKPNPSKQFLPFQDPSSNSRDPLFQTPFSQPSNASNFPPRFGDSDSSGLSRSTVPRTEPEIPAHFYTSLMARAMETLSHSTGPSPVNRTEQQPTGQLTQFAGLETHLKQLIEHACQSEGLYQKILAFISTALASALSPIGTESSGNAHTLFNELIRLNQTLREHVREPAPSIPQTVQPHTYFNPTGSHRIQTGQYDTISSTATTTTAASTRSGLYSCPYCPTYLPVFADLSTLQKHVVLLHFNLGDPLNHRSSSSVNGHEMPNTSRRPMDTILSVAYNDSRFGEPTVKPTAKPVSRKPTIPANGSQHVNLVQCNECDRCFSTHSAYRVHHTKAHDKPRMNASVRGLSDRPSSASSSRKASSWREICPR